MAFGFPVGLESPKSGLVGETERAAKGVGEETVGEVVGEEIGMLHEVDADISGAVDGMAAILAGGVDGGSIRINAAEPADGIVGFEGVPEGIDLIMAIGTGLHVAVFFQLLADGGGSANVGLDGWHIGRRRAGRGAEEFFQEPDAAGHGRGLDAVRGNGEDAGLAEQAATGRIGRQADALQVITADLGQFVEPRQPGVEIGEVGIDERGDGAVGANEFGDEAPGFLLHRRLEAVDVIGGEGLLGGRHGAELVQAEPLLGEEAQKAVAVRRIEQAVGFAADGVGLERAIDRKGAECVIRRTGGEEVGKARGELHRRDGLRVRFRFGEKEELRRTKQRLEDRSCGLGVACYAIETLLQGAHIGSDVFAAHLATKEAAG